MQVQTRHIGIAGTGLIGGSIAQALLHTERFNVIGWDLDRDSLKYAKEKGFISDFVDTMDELVSKSDVLILALPLHILTSVRPGVSTKGLRAVFDVASVRGMVSRELHSIWGNVHCGLHPMAGLEKGGIENASSDLIKDATIAIVPEPDTSEDVISIARELVTAMRALPVETTPEKHDRTVATISHLPMFLATTLAQVAGQMEEELPCLPEMSAGGFRDTSRVASGPAWLISSVWNHNEKEIRPLIRKTIDLLELMAESSPEELSVIAEEGKKYRDNILAKKGRRKNL